MDLLEIDEILGSTRSRVNSAEYLNEFIASGELGREIDLSAGTFLGKTAKQVKSSLDITRKKVSDETGKMVIPGGTDIQIRVAQETNGKRGDEKVVLSERVFIINTRLVAEARASTNGNS